MFLFLLVTLITPCWQKHPNWSKGTTELLLFASVVWLLFLCTCALFYNENLSCVDCFRGADSSNVTCNWNSICPLHLLYSCMRAKRRGWSVAVTAWNKQQWSTVTEGRARASLGNELKELGLSGCSSPAHWKYQLLLMALMRFITRILSVCVCCLVIALLVYFSFPFEFWSYSCT